jgi:hypothetical protein
MCTKDSVGIELRFREATHAVRRTDTGLLALALCGMEQLWRAGIKLPKNNPKQKKHINPAWLGKALLFFSPIPHCSFISQNLEYLQNKKMKSSKI